jgi:2-methylisocitrate lyase-like PEP mutase family enzyme
MTARFRELLRRDLVVAPSCFDPFSARLAELAGFDAIHLTGLGMEITQLGAPDLGLMSMTELVSHAARVTSAIGIPVFADVDTGFGGVLNVRRVIREMERAGVAAVHIEDQALPKQCPLIGPRRVVSRAEAIGRIKAACDARNDADFVIVARCDADVVSFDELVTRSNLYLEAGADLVMPMLINVGNANYFALEPDQQIDWCRRLARAVKGPIVGTGAPPPRGYTVQDMAQAGYSVIMFAASALSAAANAMAELFTQIKLSGNDTGYFAAHQGTYSDPLELMRAVRLKEYVEFEAQHAEGMAVGPQ